MPAPASVTENAPSKSASFVNESSAGLVIVTVGPVRSAIAEARFVPSPGSR